MKSGPIADSPPGCLIRMVDWAHRLLAEVLAPGDPAIDLTAGRGRDSLFLFRQIGPAGCLLSFDIQASALAATASLLQAAGADVRFQTAEAVPPFAPGVHLIHADHALLGRFLPAPPRAIIANLGYLPGGDPAVVTAVESTLTALQQGLLHLERGGRLAVTVYTGQAGGREESEAVASLFTSLSPAEWHVLRLHVDNRPSSPYLLVAERR